LTSDGTVVRFCGGQHSRCTPLGDGHDDVEVGRLGLAVYGSDVDVCESGIGQEGQELGLGEAEVHVGIQVSGGVEIVLEEVHHHDTASRAENAVGFAQGAGRVDGIPTIIAAMEYAFIGGSMGVVVGEKIARAIERAIDVRCPVVIVCCSGGARMMEGALSLMQMAKVCGALARLDRERLPYISVLTDPTTGGVTASFAMLGDLNIAEPKALIGFAGPRVIEQTIRQKLPDGFQRSEFLLEKGMIDMVIDRRELKATIAGALRFMGARHKPQSASAPTDGAELGTAPATLRDQDAPRVP